jgi:hypothetical protein
MNTNNRVLEIKPIQQKFLMNDLGYEGWKFLVKRTRKTITLVERIKKCNTRMYVVLEAKEKKKC